MFNIDPRLIVEQKFVINTAGPVSMNRAVKALLSDGFIPANAIQISAKGAYHQTFVKLKEPTTRKLHADIS